MYMYVEKWNAKPTWLALSLEERQQFMAKVAEAAEGLGPLGAEVRSTPSRTSWRTRSPSDTSIAEGMRWT
jgi:hypothetical protein